MASQMKYAKSSKQYGADVRSHSLPLFITEIILKIMKQTKSLLFLIN